MEVAAAILVCSSLLAGQKVGATQGDDEAYGRLIRQYLQDPRVSTELVDHLPASTTVPTPLAFFGRIPGTPGELTYAKDIHRYYQKLAESSKRARLFHIGRTEENRDMVMLAISDERTIADLEGAKRALSALSDPRETEGLEAERLIHTAKPLYWVTSGIHSPELGGPEMLTELAYRLITEESPFIRTIRQHAIVMITPVVEVDGRERAVDNYYYGKKTGKPKPPLMYWGRYVAHDNNRDGIGQFLKLTQNVTAAMLEWHPTVMHDLHESQPYLYVSTGTGPYNPALDPLQVDEWWLLAQKEILEMTRRGVPGVWTYNFYDGWVPNYLFWIAVTHNSFGRFYEVQSYGPDVQKSLHTTPAAVTHEWYRTNPPLPTIAWGPRNSVNIQESALLLALHEVAEQHELYLQNFWDKNRRSVDKGRSGPVYGWWIPAHQRARINAADMVNALRRQGLEIERLQEGRALGRQQVESGDYIIRADQPYRQLADMYFSVQNYAVSNPKPYDDTGWTMQLMRNVKLQEIRDRSLLDLETEPLESDVHPQGSVVGSGDYLLVEHTGDNSLMRWRMDHATTRMMAAEAEFQAAGRSFPPGTIIVPPTQDRSKLESDLLASGPTGLAVSEMPNVRMHELDVPRIGYFHSWLRTQDEGWVRAAFDSFHIPYTYMADTRAREGHLRERFDVIVYPHIGGTSQSQVAGVPKAGPDPIPYRKSELTPNLGGLDESDDIRGGLGLDGINELNKFVQEGGTMLVEGSTAALMADFGLAPGVAHEHPDQINVKGSIFRGLLADRKSPLLYGYDGRDLPVYFGGDTVLGLTRQQPGQTAQSGNEPELPRPRVVLQTPANENEILLSGMLGGGQALTSHPLVLDQRVGRGHIVMFAIRPFWRWQTHGTFFLGFNALLNWNDLDAGQLLP